jgi:hypothetical protein
VIIFYYASIDGTTKVPVPLASQDKYPSDADTPGSRNFVYINSGGNQPVSPNNTVVVVGTALPGLTTKTTRGVKFSSIFTLAYNSTSCPCTFFLYRSPVGIITTANYTSATNLGQVGFKVASAYTVNATIHETVTLQYVDIPPSNGTWYYAIVCIVGVTSNNGTPIGFNTASVPSTIAEEM